MQLRMAKFVIAGRADCPHFARAEMLADQLSASLPHFRVHKASHKHVHRYIFMKLGSHTYLPKRTVIMSNKAVNIVTSFSVAVAVV